MAHHPSHFIRRCSESCERTPRRDLQKVWCNCIIKVSHVLEYMRWRPWSQKVIKVIVIWPWTIRIIGTIRIIRFCKLTLTSDPSSPGIAPLFLLRWLLLLQVIYFTLDLRSFLPLKDSTDTISPKGFEEWSMKGAAKHLKINCYNYPLNNFVPLFRLYILYMKGYVQPNQKLAGFGIYSSLCKKI